ncbi:unnamed protein product [Fraxinus pennsylvanica]|uniref:Major facilitator superfamily (MFS) profile domain-containing protein n=1 Tax=Fraxinus pennsylvanica TaxID=56036 RepID=A0AAD1ZEP7_9LAMI|nr:unnamed protein product [Fraxinus pennsylvanica]
MATSSIAVLNALDNARIQWYHVNAIVIAGMGIFTGAYDVFCISTIVKLLNRLYYHDPSMNKSGRLPHNVNNFLIGVALVGTQTGYPKAVMGTLCFFRFWLGFGIGGDYTLSATIMSEYANKKTRGAFIAAVFAMQGVGTVFAGLMSMILSIIFLNKYKGTQFLDNGILYAEPEADYVWRIVLMLELFLQFSHSTGG